MKTKLVYVVVCSLLATCKAHDGIKVPNGSIVAGNPAKVIKNGVHWCRERL